MATDSRKTLPVDVRRLDRRGSSQPEENIELPEQVIRILLLGLAVAYAYILLS